MLISIHIQNSFAHQDSFITFTNGLNVITGKNGTGKTELVEMINYAFFGARALRDSASNYKDLSVTLIFKVVDKVYKIVRSSTVALYYLDTKYIKICSGVTAANKHIEELLTYGKDVFYLTNFCKQHDLLSFSALKEKPLLNLIETVTGLKDSYLLIDYFKKQKSILTAEKKTYETLLADNNIPDFEINSEFEEFTEDQLADIKLLVAEHFNAIATQKEYLFKYNFYKNKVQEFPSLPAESYDELLKICNDFNTANDSLKTIDLKLSRIQTYNIDDTLDNLLEIKEQHPQYKNYLTLLKYQEHNLTCPTCSSIVNVNQESIDSLLAQGIYKSAPKYSLNKIEEYINWLTIDKNIYESLMSEKLELLATISNVDYKASKLKLDQHLKYNEILLSNSDILNEIAKLEAILGYPLDTLEESIIAAESQYSVLVSFYDDALNYLRSKTMYDYSMELKNKLLVDINTHNSKLRFINNCLQYAEQTKKDVQLVAIPTLNYAASNYLNLMTGGERTTVEITNDFKLLVDNISLDLVEGSAQVLSNIALRLAILKMYYKDNFCVFIGDELDESLHEDRFNMLNTCFNTLANTGYQIIIISHKTYDDANIIDLNLCHDFKND
jgi:energy-coupling factor transporter ATP-binding protein EcfA2